MTAVQVGVCPDWCIETAENHNTHRPAAPMLHWVNHLVDQRWALVQVEQFEEWPAPLVYVDVDMDLTPHPGFTAKEARLFAAAILEAADTVEALTS